MKVESKYYFKIDLSLNGLIGSLDLHLTFLLSFIIFLLLFELDQGARKRFVMLTSKSIGTDVYGS